VTIEDLRKQWPRPRVGERVTLWDTEHIGDVVSVRGAKEIIKLMREVQAMRFGPDMQATYGPHWMKIYYQADIMVKNKLRTVEPRDVKGVLPPD